MLRIGFAALFAVLLATPVHAEAADANMPHEHQGIFKPYAGAPPIPTLSTADVAKLEKGETVLKQTKDSDGGGKGVAIQDVHADAATIWSKITQYDMYPKWVKGVYETEVYAKTADSFQVRFLIGSTGIKKEYFIRNKYRPTEGYTTWTLDYSRLSDFDDCIGFWRIEAIPGKPGWSRVYYSVQLKLKGWVPGFIISMLTNNGLTQATEWVKRESEKSAGK